MSNAAATSPGDRASTNGDASPDTALLDLEGGFLALPRKLCGSALFDSLRADERYVVVTMLLRAQWAPGEFYFGGRRFDLAPGSLIDSEEALARAAGSTRKVVRTTRRKLEEAGLVARRRVHPAGQCPFVTTIIGYERILLRRAAPGPRTGPPTGHERANSGPADGPHQNQGDQVKPGNPSLPSPAVRGERGVRAPRRSAAAPASPPEAFTGRSGSMT